MTNAELAKTLDTSDEWIQQRTGIKERRFAAEGELTSSMGTRAAEAALDMAGMRAEDIDLIVCATSTPDETFPSAATRIQAQLGRGKGRGRHEEARDR